MIKSFRHKGLEAFFRSGSRAGMQAVYAKRLSLQLAKLDTAKAPVDMELPGWKLHRLAGNLKNHWAVWIDKNWRMTFRFNGGNAVLVDYRNCH